MTHEPISHPHRRTPRSGFVPVREQTFESLERSLLLLDGELLQAALQVATTIELLAADDLGGALEALEVAQADIEALR